MRKIRIEAIILSCALIFFFPFKSTIKAQQENEHLKSKIVILADHSGSMKNTDPRGLSLALIEYFLDQISFLRYDARVAIMPFATRTSVIPQGGLTADLLSLFDELKRFPSPQGLTDMEVALKEAYKLLLPFKDNEENLVILITDGQPYPDPTDRDRFPDTADEFYKEAGSSPPNSSRFNSLMNSYSTKASPITRNNILEVVAPTLRDKVNLFSIALSTSDIDKEFLKNLLLETSSSPSNFKIVESNNELILAANELFPKGHQILTFFEYNNTGIQESEIKRSFTLPISLNKFRVVINYLETNIKENEVEIEIKAPNGETINRASSQIEYLAAKDKRGEGNLVFERFYFPSPITEGEWQIRVKAFPSRIYLPNVLIISEGKTEAEMNLVTYPADPEVGQNIEIITRIQDPQGRTIPLQDVEGKIIDPEGNVHPLDFKVGTDGIAKASYKSTLLKKGKHIVEATAFLNKELKQYMKSNTTFTTKPPQPVNIYVTIPYNVPEGSLTKDKLTFPPLGGKYQEQNINGILVENDSTESATVTLSLDPLQDKNGVILSQSEWLLISPRNTGQTKKDNPFRFNLKAKLPKKIPEDLKNGTFQGSLKIDSESIKEPIEVPVELPIIIPDFKIPQSIKFTKWWELPGISKKSVKLTTDTAYPIKVKLNLPQWLKNEDGIFIEPDKLKLEVETQGEEFEVSSGNPQKITIIAETPVRNIKGKYSGEATWEMENSRNKSSNVEIIIPKYPLKSIVKLILLISGIIFLVLGFAFRNSWKKIKDVAKGTTRTLHHRVLREKPFQFRDLFSITAADTGFTLNPFSYNISVNKETVTGPRKLESNDRITVEDFDILVRCTQSICHLFFKGSPYSRFKRKISNLLFFAASISILLAIFWIII